MARLSAGIHGHDFAVTGVTEVPPRVRSAVADLLRRRIDDATVILTRGGELVYRVDTGGMAADTELPVASASKWMAAALAMTVVDDGRLSLDGSIARLLPDFTGTAEAITLRQLLTHTAGTGTLKGLVDVLQSPRITFARSAALIARRPLEDPPGTVFKYGGPGFHLTGALVEAATGGRWSTLFDERIARPLGMTHTRWTHPPTNVPASETLNPLLQGGVITTADDYMRFLIMLSQGGTRDGCRILSTASVDAMESVQTLGLPMAWVPPGHVATDQYGFGNWIERWTQDGRGLLVGSPGIWGTYPWIERETGLCGIIFLKDRLSRIRAQLVALRDAMIETTR